MLPATPVSQAVSFHQLFQPKYFIFLISITCLTYTSQIMLINFIIFSEQHKLWGCSICHFLHLQLIPSIIQHSSQYLVIKHPHFIPGVHKSQVPGHPGDKLLKSCAYLLWVLSMEIIPCHTSSNWNFEVAPRLLENLQIT